MSAVTVAEGRAHCAALALMLSGRPERHSQSEWVAPEYSNECGTAACVAGWGGLWSLGRVAIDDAGVMTWPGRVVNRDPETRHWDDLAADWLALEVDGDDYPAARLLFIETHFYDDPEKLAVEVLRRIGDGRLGTEGALTGRISFGWDELNEVAEAIGLDPYELGER